MMMLHIVLSNVSPQKVKLNERLFISEFILSYNRLFSCICYTARYNIPQGAAKKIHWVKKATIFWDTTMSASFLQC